MLMMGGDGVYFEHSDIKLYYEKTGTGAPLILLHGNGEDHEIFLEAIEILKEHFTVFALDSRGHGKSSAVSELHYSDMAEDVYHFILENQMEQPVIYGFSDGGIVALLLCIRHPELIQRAIVSGVNVHPHGIKGGWLALFGMIYFFTKSPAYALMLHEPDISKQDLASITVPVDVIGGSRDMISRRHMQAVAAAIPGGSFTELKNETHGSYVVHSEKIAHIILKKTK